MTPWRVWWPTRRRGTGLWRLDLETRSTWESLGPPGFRVFSVLPLVVSDRLPIGIEPQSPHTTRLLRSDNHGMNWDPSDAGTCGGWPYIGVIREDPDQPGRVLAGGSALYESEDSGVTWEVVYSDLQEPCDTGAFSVQAIVFSPSSSADIWLGVRTGFGQGWLIRSEDDGSSWVRRSTTAGVPEWIDFTMAAPEYVYVTEGTNFFRTHVIAGPQIGLYDSPVSPLVGGHVDPSNDGLLCVGVSSVDFGNEVLFLRGW